LSTDTLPLRTLGRSPLAVSRLGLGCANFGREITEAEAFALMDHAVARGITLFDTAEAYGAAEARAYRRDRYGTVDKREVSDESHSSEKIIGRWLHARGARKAITLVTKIKGNYTVPGIQKAISASLERLQSDHVDIYLYHAQDPAVPAEEAMSAADLVVERQWATVVGCSNFSAAQIQAHLECSRRLGSRRFEVVESAYNLLTREIEQGVLPLAQEQQLGVLGYSPLAGGFLTGKYRDGRDSVPAGSRFDVIPGYADLYFTPDAFAKIVRLHAFASRARVRIEQLAVAWTLRHPDVTTMLVGARSTAHLDNAIDALSLAQDDDLFAGMDT
jgi:aryl-alcohol dehydrogenase-like predicted oxidoreductase